MKFDAALMVMYPTVTMPADNDFHQNLPSVSEVLTSMASGVIASDSERYTNSEELMDSISSGYTTSVAHNTTQHAIPTSVITPTTSLANGWLEAQNSNLHGGFVPPPVSSSNALYAIPTSAIRSVPQSQQRIISAARISKEDLDLLRMSPSNSRRRIRDDELPPEERVKRKQRRERNKLAAAKCRQRRVDHTNALVQETEEWESKNSTLEQELAKLQQQKEQLEFILEAHKAMCKKNKDTTNTPIRDATPKKVVPLDTPSTEVVTPTSAFKKEVFDDSVPAGSLSPSCGREIKKESSSDLSSPESNRTMIEL